MSNLKFPPSIEIKRAIAAAERTGNVISSIETHPREIIIIARDPTNQEPKQQTYSEKAIQRELKSKNSRDDGRPE